MNVTKMERHHKAALAHVVSAAFEDYATIQYILHDSGANFYNHLHALVGFFLETRFIRGAPILGVLHGDVLAAAAGIDRPEDRSWSAELAAALDDLKQTVGSAAVARLQEYEGAVKATLPDLPFYYLGFLAVHPHYQGRGMAKRMMEKVKEIAHAAMPTADICLNTEDARNLAFYHSQGFKIIEQTDLSRLRSWCMQYSRSSLGHG